MDAVSLYPSETFNKLVLLYVYDTSEEVLHIAEAYSWRDSKPGEIVYLQEAEKEAKVITRAEYETFEVFQNDQDS